MIQKLLLIIVLISSVLLTGCGETIDPEEVPLEGSGVVIDAVQPLFQRLSVLVGGIFGLYIILILIRVHYERKKVKILSAIRYDLDHLNMYYKVPHSRSKKGPFRKALHYIKNTLFHKK